MGDARHISYANLVGQLANNPSGVVVMAETLGVPTRVLSDALATAAEVEPDLRSAILLEISGQSVETSFASPDTSNPLALIAALACTPSSLTAMSYSAAGTVTLLRSLYERAATGLDWSLDWFRHEAFRIATLSGCCDDDDLWLNATSSRMDTAWTLLAAECVYRLFKEKQATVDPGTLWIHADNPPEQWMYALCMERMSAMPWLTTLKPYSGVTKFVERLQANGKWRACIYDSDDIITIEDDTTTLIDWFGCYAFCSVGEPLFDNYGGYWRIPFMSAKEGVGVAIIDTHLSEHPAALIGKLVLPGVRWAIGGESNLAVPELGKNEDEEPTVDISGDIVPISEVDVRKALDMGLFFQYDDAGHRIYCWCVTAHGEDSRHDKFSDQTT